MAWSLHTAASNGSLKKVRKLLNRAGVDVDARDSQGHTPFALAWRRKHFGIVRVLLEAGADPRQEFDSRFPWLGRTTAASDACRMRNKEMLELLIQFGVSANDICNGRPLLVQAAYAPYGLGIVKLLLRHGAYVDGRDSTTLNSALHLACERGDMPLARLLLEAGASVDIINAMHETPLFVACITFGVSLELPKLLLQFGAVVNGCTAHQHENETRPLVAALYSNRRLRMARLRLLIKHGGDFHSPLFDGATPLHVAAAENICEETTNLLLKKGADPNTRDREGRTPLQTLCLLPYNRRVAGVTTVLLKHGAEVEVTNDEGSTPLIDAVMEDEPGMMERLLDQMDSNFMPYE